MPRLELKRSWKVGLVRDLCQDRPHPLTRDCFHPVSNWGPFACEANVITTTLRKQITLALDPFGTEEILESGLNLKVVSRQTTGLNKTLVLAPFGTEQILESGFSEGLVPRQTTSLTEEILESGLNLKVVSRQTTALNKRLFPPSFEMGTFRVLGERDNHYTMETDNTGP